jgi:hypothetical protein
MKIIIVFASGTYYYTKDPMVHTTFVPSWVSPQFANLGFPSNSPKGTETRTPVARLLGRLLDALIFTAKFVFWLIEE